MAPDRNTTWLYLLHLLLAQAACQRPDQSHPNWMGLGLDAGPAAHARPRSWTATPGPQTRTLLWQGSAVVAQVQIPATSLLATPESGKCPPQGPCYAHTLSSSLVISSSSWTRRFLSAPLSSSRISAPPAICLSWDWSVNGWHDDPHHLPSRLAALSTRMQSLQNAMQAPRVSKAAAPETT
jgi:hypothetical protein